MQINDLEFNEFLNEISYKESVTVKGSDLQTAAAYITVVRALNPTLAESPVVLNTAFLLAIDVLPAPGSNSSR